MSTGIITTAVLLIVGYVILTKVIGLAFRLVVPAVLIMVLAGAGIFSGLMPDHALDRYPADRAKPYGQDLHVAEEASRLGDVRLRDIADTVIEAARSILQSTLALLDRAADPGPAEQSPSYSEPRHPQRDRFGEPPHPSYDDPSSWAPSPRPGRVY